MKDQHRPNYDIAADLCLIAADCYLRQAHWSLAHFEDLSIFSEHGIALNLGVPERGESTKTGVRQGVRPDHSGVADLLQQYKSRSKPGRRLFELSPAQFAHFFN